MTPEELATYETATEIYAEYIGWLATQSYLESKKDNPNMAKLKALSRERDELLEEDGKLSSKNEFLINKALYIYAPILQMKR